MAFIKFKPLTSILNYTSVIGNPEEVKELKEILLEDEKIYVAAKATRDLFAISDKRIIIIDLKGFRGFRKSIYTVNFRAIATVSIEIRNIDTALVINLNSGHVIEIRFSKPLPLEHVYAIYNYITGQMVV